MKTSLLTSLLALTLAAACTSGSSSGNDGSKKERNDGDDAQTSSADSDSVDSEDDGDSESSSSSSKKASRNDENEKEEEETKTSGKAPGATCKEDTDCSNELCLFDTGADFGTCTTECTTVANCPGGVAKWSACEKLDNTSGKYCIPR